MLSRSRGRHCLRHKVFLLARHAVIERPPIHRRKLVSKITMSRRARYGPFESCRMPRIALGTSTRKDADEEIEQKYQLGSAQDECCKRDENVHRLLFDQEHVLGRIVNAAHLSADTQNVHRKEYAVGADKCEPEMHLAEGVIHQTAEHLRKPEINTGECGE